MRIRHKQNACLNCGYRLNSEIYNYCPSCGQENTNMNLSFGRLIVDFVSNVFALDSRFVNSFGPFFLKPGFLTNRFNEGKRASYASPVRLYLIISLFFFFALSLAGKRFSSELEKNRDLISADITLPDPDEPTLAVPDSVKKQLQAISREADFFDAQDSLELNLDSPDLTGSRSGNFGLSGESWATYNRLKDNRRISDDMLFDSLKLETSSNTAKFLIRQFIRIERADSQIVVDFVTKNLPILMFLMLPIFALILKLLYVRRRFLYINHLIHAIHLHCMAYIIYGSAIIFLLSDVDSDQAKGWVITISILLVTVYSFISFLRVYGQRWGKTLVKFCLLGWIYSCCLLFGTISEMLISFLLF